MKRTKKSTGTRYILANDPSITGWGWAVLEPNGNIVETGCIKTSPEHKKKRIRKGDDSVRRIHDVNLVLMDVLERYNIVLILSELQHGSQNAQAAVMIGVVSAIAQTLSDVFQIPIEWYSEGDSKMASLGKRAATKNEMIVAIDKLYEVPWRGIKYMDEAVADAISIFHVAQEQSEVIKFLKNM